MKLSMEHHVIRKNFGDAEAIRMIAKAGFDALDFSFYWLYGEENFLDREDRLEYAKELRAVADEAGIAITQAHAPFDLKLTASKEQQAYDYEQIVRAIEFAGILDVQQIVVHNLVTADNADFEKVNLEFYRSLEATAAKANVRIAVENLWKRAGDKIIGERLSTPKTLSAFLDQLNPEHFCACLDVGHSAILGQNPADFVRGLGPVKLQALHIHDTDLLGDSHTLPYLGKHNWAEITRALGETGYQGDLTLEIVGFLRALPKDALFGALQLAHAVGRSLIADIERAACRGGTA